MLQPLVSVTKIGTQVSAVTQTRSQPASPPAIHHGAPAAAARRAQPLRRRALGRGGRGGSGPGRRHGGEGAPASPFAPRGSGAAAAGRRGREEGRGERGSFWKRRRCRYGRCVAAAGARRRGRARAGRAQGGERRGRGGGARGGGRRRRGRREGGGGGGGVLKGAAPRGRVGRGGGSSSCGAQHLPRRRGAPRPVRARRERCGALVASVHRVLDSWAPRGLRGASVELLASSCTSLASD